MSNDSQAIEKRIARSVIKDLLAAGFTVSVNDGEVTTLQRSTDPAAILAAMFTTDEDYLFTNYTDHVADGWVRFIYGNDGWDVINDYTTNLETVLTPTNALADRIGDIGYATVLEEENEVLSVAVAMLEAERKPIDLDEWKSRMIDVLHDLDYAEPSSTPPDKSKTGAWVLDILMRDTKPKFDFPLVAALIPELITALRNLVDAQQDGYAPPDEDPRMKAARAVLAKVQG